MMDSRAIARTFLEFFEKNGHTVVESSSLVPDDPTLLLTNAGMNQFKPYFVGEKSPPYSRATSLQKCMRAGGKDSDLERVGKDARGLFLFQMLGNFAFGDYFKREAIGYAWELVTEIFGLEADRLWATVFHSDDVAAEIWQKEVGVPGSRVLRRGYEDGNFWHTGVAGPCGPCSEILYDRGEAYGNQYSPGEVLDEDRYFEIWNLVFMDSMQDDDLNVVGELPKQNIDTGAGLERLATAIQGVPTIFDTDQLSGLVAVAEGITGRRYGEDPSSDVALRVLAEHSRAMTFLIADGVFPSNLERGYVLRRVIRRAIRYARLAGLERPFLSEFVDPVVEEFGEVYPEVARGAELAKQVLAKEEERFDATLRAGFGMLEEEIERGRTEGQVISGEVAFKLHDTYGFPIDLTEDIAGEEGFGVDKAGFDELMERQRVRARGARVRGRGAQALAGEVASQAVHSSPTFFEGYETLTSQGVVHLLLTGHSASDVLGPDDEAVLILDKTPFYAESGGQVGDTGIIKSSSGVFEVSDTYYDEHRVIRHKGRVKEGEIERGQEVTALVNPEHREGVTKSHTATHMLHWALRKALGDHARQQGSLVEPGRLRFDFSHFEAVGDQQLAAIETEINSRSLDDDPVRAFETTLEYSKSIGAMALFGEKYGDFVRVVEVGEYSKELCGGTHVTQTGQVGVVKLVAEGSVAAGTRRVEALVGMRGLEFLLEAERNLKRAASAARVDPDQLFERIEQMSNHIRSLESDLSKVADLQLGKEVEEVLGSDSVTSVNGSKLAVIGRTGAKVRELQDFAIAVRDGLGSGIAIVSSKGESAANIVVALTGDLVAKGSRASEIVAVGASKLGGGSGGGRPDLAIAGGGNVERLDEAVAAVVETARGLLAK